MNAKWYYSDDQGADNKLVDSFKDSKFSMDRWNSFAREIVQNSIDARDDDNKPVKVVFDLNKTLTINDIPGAVFTRNVLAKCMEAVTNKQTKGSYKKGLDILDKENVYCLKISDYNTKGVRTGRDQAWGAFVFDEGKSVKQRPGSAGSHGVGKKVPFIISTCNTVFYATKNKYSDGNGQRSDCLVQGKTQLTNWWDDVGTKKSDKGWFGIVNESENVKPEDRINPITDSFEGINPYFVRNDEYGTDVIIIGVNIYDEEEEVKKRIINAILSNFYVAIKNNDLEVDVMGVSITNSTFDDVFKRFYSYSDVYGNDLVDSLEALKEDPVSIPLEDLGCAQVYFKLGNQRNKKYYTIVRSHGMKIVDKRVNSADQPYTAVVFVEGEKINTMLSELENAAHDDFVTDDEDIEIPNEYISAFRSLTNKVKELIIEKTKIDSSEPQEIEGLNSIVVIPGTFAVINKKDSKPLIRKNPVRKKSKGKKAQDFKKGQGQEGEGKGKIKKKGKGHKPAEKGENNKSVLYNNYAVDPFFVKTEKGVTLTFQLDDDIDNGELLISSINSDEKADNSIGEFINSVSIDSKKYKAENGRVKGLDFESGKIYRIEISLNRDLVYQLKAYISYKEVTEDE